MTRALFMGSDAFSVPILEALLERGPQLHPSIQTVGVVTQPDRGAGRGRRLQSSPVKLLAVRHGLPMLQPDGLRDPESLEPILRLDPGVIVVASFGQILPRALLDVPAHRSINVHPSLLPLLRGPSPVTGAILEGEAETGVSLMVMTAKMDAGPVLSQERTPIGPDETAGALLGRLAVMGAGLLLRDLPAWLDGRLQPSPQDDARATYTQLINKADGLIDWTAPAEMLARRVRAFNPWPVAYTFWGARTLRILRARPGQGSGEPGQALGLRDGALEIGTGGGTLLADELQLAGGRPLAASELVRGHADLLRARFGGAS
jgi:methionyl-tRNA formyltransferase